MTTAIQPPWGTDWKPAPAPPAPPVRGAGNPAWTPGCPSPNPKGRPAGVPDKRLLATQQMLDEMRNIIAVLVGKALEGDTNAASIVLAKILPSVKAQAEKVSFDFDASLPISEQVAQVLDAVAAGAVAPDVGRLIIEPEPWDYDGCKRREPVMDADNAGRVVRKVGWHRCLKCRRPFFSEDVLRLRLCSGAQGCRGDEDRFT